MTNKIDQYRFAIDRGGTFTDIYASCPDGKIKILKILSQNPSQYSDAPLEGIKRILRQELGDNFKNKIEWIRIGTTLATNSLLERKGERLCLAITKGFKDALFIGNQSRPKLFELDIKIPEVIYDCVIEVEERLWLAQSECQIADSRDSKIVESDSGEKYILKQSLNEKKLKSDLATIASKGITSLAVVLIHSYGWSGHEDLVEKYALEAGFKQVSLSSKVMSMVGFVPRGQTTCVDAYLTPCIKTYVSGFVQNIKDLIDDQQMVPIHFMQSDGGLVNKDQFIGSRAILSGPAGGVIGYSKTTIDELGNIPVIGFDMGGTSTDVSRFDGEYEHVYDTVIGGITMQCPQLDIQTVASGGGSRLFFRAGLFVVGPESAGATPGPTCYRKGGPLCVTDANLCLGRLIPKYFPKIFGQNSNMEIDKIASQNEFQKLTNQIYLHYKGLGKEIDLNVQQIAIGFLNVANETMCRTIRNITQAKGYESSKHVLACFGSAAGQHACSIAKSLGIKKIFIHKYSGILSAYGMALADIVHDIQEPLSIVLDPDSRQIIDLKFEFLRQKCLKHLVGEGFSEGEIEIENYLQLCYKDTQCLLMCPDSNETHLRNSVQRFQKVFLQKYETEFGFTIPGRDIMIENIRVRGIGNSGVGQNKNIEGPMQTFIHLELKPEDTAICYFQKSMQDPQNIEGLPTNIYFIKNLKPNILIHGPAILLDDNSTILVEPGFMAYLTSDGNVILEIFDKNTATHKKDDLSKDNLSKNKIENMEKSEKTSKNHEINPIKLSLFSHRFMGIAEQMGKMLKRMAISTNIKERLDFSCAIFGPDGGLVANAPHIPVHLGSMQEAVKYQMATLADKIKDGDVILTNHPCAGGSHLPDLTVIKPVFHESSMAPIFFVASRGHHADIGGIMPGSMPATSTRLSEEGATFKSFMLIEDGKFRENELKEEFMKPGLLAGSSGSRKLGDNLADLKAQVAACQKGIQLVHSLIREYGMEEVINYMLHIRTNAKETVSQMFKDFKSKNDWRENTGENLVEKLHAKDYMDDGTMINLTVDIDKTKGEAKFDFTGTGYQVLGNTNTPKAIVLSALLYCLRCMVGHDIPLNQGCLEPVEVIIPEGSILNPSDDAAVVGGNVLTSQRIVDVIFKAFQTCAASQGCMNNVTFGDSDCVYYETIAGGAGAAFGFNGRSGIHTHMTNTRITDPEVFERRFPIILKQFSLRPGSGGFGTFRGGDGVIREIMFRKCLNLSILSERRVFHPYGLEGGQDGERGVNLLIHPDGRKIYMGSKSSTIVEPGDTLLIKTPGGGGYGI